MEPSKVIQNTTVSSALNVTNKIYSESIVREISPNETKYAIAKEYGITVAELDKANQF
jgi:LysM repeat protein